MPPEQPAPASDEGFLDTPLIQTISGVEPAVYGWAGVVTAAAIVVYAFYGSRRSRPATGEAARTG